MENPGSANAAQADIGAANIFLLAAGNCAKKYEANKASPRICPADMYKPRFSAHRPITRPAPTRAGLGERN